MKQILLNDWYLDERELARRLANSGICSESRGKMIVRTERHGAQQYGGLYYATDLGFELKEWRTTGDKRVRPSHQSLNSELKLITEPFSNGHMVPDEPRCRCRAMYLSKNDVDKKTWDYVQKNAVSLARLPAPGVPVSGFPR